MADIVHFYRTAERPDAQFWLRDSAGSLVDLSTGYTFEFKLGQPGTAATFTKTSGITGAAGSGVAPPGVGTPNCTVSFSAAENDGLAVGATTWQIRARTGTSDRFWQGSFVLHDVIT